MRRARVLGTLAFAGALAVGAFGLCSARSAGATPEDRETATSILADVEASARVSASPRQAMASDLTARARQAMARASAFRAKGDEAHARLADGLAKTWAEAARDLLRAVDAEERGARLRSDSMDAGAQSDRERALLEEATAQVGRLKAQLEQVERATKEEPARTSKAASERTNDKNDKAAPKGTRAEPAAVRDGGAP